MTKKKPTNLRKHCLFRANELALITEARNKTEKIDHAKCSFSHFLRYSAVHNAEIITGKKITP
jgi:hypothetical protein